MPTLHALWVTATPPVHRRLLTTPARTGNTAAMWQNCWDTPQHSPPRTGLVTAFGGYVSTFEMRMCENTCPATNIKSAVRCIMLHALLRHRHTCLCTEWLHRRALRKGLKLIIGSLWRRQPHRSSLVISGRQYDRHHGRVSQQQFRPSPQRNVA